jgi:hypothetical protein
VSHQRWSFGEVLRRVGDWFKNFDAQEFNRQLSATLTKWQQSDWGYVLGELPGLDGIAFMAGLEREDQLRRSNVDISAYGNEDLIERRMEEALAHPAWLAEVGACIERAALDSAARSQLQKALEFIERHDYELAVPLLVIPLEGALWQVAIDDGLVETRGDAMFLTAKASPNQRKITSVAAVLDLPQLSLDLSLRRFVRGLAYGEGVHRERHGRGSIGWRRRAFYLLIALAGWLEHQGTAEQERLLRRAFIEAAHRRRAAVRGDEAA